MQDSVLHASYVHFLILGLGLTLEQAYLELAIPGDKLSLGIRRPVELRL